jgi:hypothetical protein
VGLDLDEFLSSLPEELEPISGLALRLRSDGVDVKADAIAVSHRPHVAPHSYALRLYAPLPFNAISKYEQTRGITISPHYLPIIKKLNGTHAFEFSLYGIPPSMASDLPLLDRSVAQPYDIGTANRFWKLEYSVPQEWFHFGGGPYSYDENIGYFFDPEGKILASRKNGEVLRNWTSFKNFLSDEIAMAEKKYPEHEAFMSQLIQGAQKKNPWWKRIFMK